MEIIGWYIYICFQVQQSVELFIPGISVAGMFIIARIITNIMLSDDH